MNLFLPRDAAAGLVVPPVAITDGSPDPVWADVPYRARFVYSRTRTLRLPLDAGTAEAVRRLVVTGRRERAVYTPVSLALAVTALTTLWVPENPVLDRLRPASLVAIAVLAFWSNREAARAAVAQQPVPVHGHGVYLPAVADAAAREWMRLNPAVRPAAERPRIRRYPPRRYLEAAGLCAAVAAAVWWTALRDGEFPLATLAGFVALLVAVLVLAGKALVPPGFIRLDDEPR